MARWMLVQEDMNWFEVELRQEGNDCIIHIFKKNKDIEAKLVKENEMTKVKQFQDVITDEYIEVVDFKEMDRFFEENKVIFKNRKGLHNEVRRYIDFSLKKVK